MTDPDKNGEAEEVEEVLERDGEEQPETIDPISKAEGRANIRQTIDLMLASGVDQDEIEDMLEHLADGVEYYAEDIQWYNNQQAES